MLRTALGIMMLGGGLLAASPAQGQTKGNPRARANGDPAAESQAGTPPAPRAGGGPTRDGRSETEAADASDAQPSGSPADAADTGRSPTPDNSYQAPAHQSDSQRSKQLAPPVQEPTLEQKPPTPVDPWFVRPLYTLSAGEHSDWKLSIYGFAEADVIRDSTRSFNDGLNNNVLAHENTQARDNPRLQFTIRNSRIGFRAEAPKVGGLKPTGLLEFDLFGNQPTINSGGGSSGQAPGNGDTTEQAYFNNAGLRVRHAYVKVEDDVVDVLAGQTYRLLGWQNYFFGATCGFLGIPNELFNRTVQVRLSHVFATDAVNFEIAAAGLRPAQRDSGIPDVEGGARLSFNHWKGMTTPGSGGTGALPAALAVSALTRAFRVDPYAPLPAPSIKLNGWALAANVLLPVIPVKDNTDRSNAFTLTGEFVTGTGDADEYTGMTAGATMPNVYPLQPDAPINSLGQAVPQMPGSAPQVGLPYTPDVDAGLVAFDSNGVLHSINWQTLVVGAQYYLPPNGRLFISGNYSLGRSNNIASLYHPGAIRQPWVNSQAVFHKSRYVDANVFFDFTASVRMGLSYQRVTQELADGTSSNNDRFEATFLYFL